MGVESGAEGGGPRALLGGSLGKGERVVSPVGVREEERELEKSLLVARFVPQHLSQQFFALLVTPLLQLNTRLGDEREREREREKGEVSSAVG